MVIFPSNCFVNIYGTLKEVLPEQINIHLFSISRCI